MITLEQLKNILPFSTAANRQKFLIPLNSVMAEFEINTKPRIASFIAQIGHESGSLRYVEEIASGKAYEGRKDLGNTHPGDGVKFKGRGLIQITGRANYEKCGLGLGLNLIDNPELLELPENACRSAGWFWKKISGNALADTGNFKVLTRRINGGLNGYEDRLAIYEKAKTFIV